MAPPGRAPRPAPTRAWDVAPPTMRVVERHGPRRRPSPRPGGPGRHRGNRRAARRIKPWLGRSGLVGSFARPRGGGARSSPIGSGLGYSRLTMAEKIGELQSETPSNSRQGLGGAGWTCEERGSFTADIPQRAPLSWLNLSTLWRSRNDIVAKLLGDPVDDLRRAWLQAALSVEGASLTIDHTGAEAVTFLIVGDPGEGDASQWATVPALESLWGATSFLLVASDVIYPSGDTSDYENKFYRPFRDYPGPIYAVPGNHDWYDELRGFMFHLCQTEEMAEPSWTYRGSLGLGRRLLNRLLWRRPRAPATTARTIRNSWRPQHSQRSTQRTPYWTIETDVLRIVGIDTGIGGGIDHDQGEWLRTVSADREIPKLLVTGKPIYVDNEYHPGPIEGGGTVDEIVRDPGHNYLAAVGGDIHNYQRYPVKVGDRVIQYIVSGGGGAFMHETHKIPRVRLPGVDEDDFVCYPRRGDSLSLFSKLWDRKLGFGRGYFEIRPDEAAALMGERLGVRPTRVGDRRTIVPERSRRAAEKILPLPGRARGPLHDLFAVFFDWNEAPMFKSFLRVEADKNTLRLRCHAATGCFEHEDHPPLEDEVVAERSGTAWTWRRMIPGS